MSKPPLGVMSRKIWLEHRLADLTAAMGRCVLVGKLMPRSWVGEVADIYEELSREEEPEPVCFKGCRLVYRDHLEERVAKLEAHGEAELCRNCSRWTHQHEAGGVQIGYCEVLSGTIDGSAPRCPHYKRGEAVT